MIKNKTLLVECHDIVNEDDMTASHNLVDVMFNLLDINQLNKLQEIITELGFLHNALNHSKMSMDTLRNITGTVM